MEMLLTALSEKISELKADLYLIDIKTIIGNVLL